jgi:hypothetical protein
MKKTVLCMSLVLSAWSIAPLLCSCDADVQEYQATEEEVRETFLEELEEDLEKLPDEHPLELLESEESLSEKELTAQFLMQYLAKVAPWQREAQIAFDDTVQTVLEASDYSDIIAYIIDILEKGDNTTNSFKQELIATLDYDIAGDPKLSEQIPYSIIACYNSLYAIVKTVRNKYLEFVQQARNKALHEIKEALQQEESPDTIEDLGEPFGEVLKEAFEELNLLTPMRLFEHIASLALGMISVKKDCDKALQELERADEQEQEIEILTDMLEECIAPTDTDMQESDREEEEACSPCRQGLEEHACPSQGDYQD